MLDARKGAIGLNVCPAGFGSCFGLVFPLICTGAVHGCHGNSEVHDLVLIFQELTGKSLF